MSAQLVIENLSFSYGNNRILNNLNVSFGPAVTALVGPNGAGKSTLIKCIAGVLKPKGTIKLSSSSETNENDNFGPETLNEGRAHTYKNAPADLERSGIFRQSRCKTPNKSDAKSNALPISQMSYLPQSLPTNTALTVFEIVLLGLVDSLSLRVRDDQLEQVMDTLSYLGIEPLATTRLNNLSGGQQQMVSLAQALVKNPQALLLDEPLNSLDIRRQFEILNKIREITYLSPRIVIIAMHDLNLAAKYADSVLALHHGKIYAHGTPENALTEPMIRDLYGMRSEVTLKDGRIPHIRLLDVIEQEPDMPVGFGGR